MPNYTVKKGDTLSQIARASGYSLSDVMAANKGIDYNRISIGQEIALPYGNKPPVNYDAFGSVINRPDSPQDYVNTSRAQIVEQPAPINTTGYNLSAGIPVAQSQRAEVVDTNVPAFSDRFINYVGKVEGIINEKGGEQGRTPFRYPSKEGGRDTVGIGHKLTQDQIDSNSVYTYDLDTLTQEQVDLIFVKDLELTVKGLDTVLQKEHNTSYKDLTPKQQEMLLDIHFNVKTGIKAFPEFTKGVIKNDLSKMRKEYVRYMKDPKTGEMVPLGRNKIFYDTYLK